MFFAFKDSRWLPRRGIACVGEENLFPYLTLNAGQVDLRTQNLPHPLRLFLSLIIYGTPLGVICLNQGEGGTIHGNGRPGWLIGLVEGFKELVEGLIGLVIRCLGLGLRQEGRIRVEHFAVYILNVGMVPLVWLMRHLFHYKAYFLFMG